MKGKEGTVYLVTIDGVDYARKEFKSTKSFKRIQREATFQAEAAAVGVAPVVISVDKSPPSITMDKMKETVIDVIKNQNGKLDGEQQLKILSLYRRLDEIGILHNDSNPLNLMTDGENWKLIDYGFTKKKTKKHGDNPNLNISLKLLLHSTMGLITRKLLVEEPTILLNALKNKDYTQDNLKSQD